jgi:hypothetical protein
MLSMSRVRPRKTAAAITAGPERQGAKDRGSTTSMYWGRRPGTRASSPRAARRAAAAFRRDFW